MSAEDDADGDADAKIKKIDREAETPPHGLTNTWELHAKIADDLRGQLDGLERDARHLHPERADLYRGLRLAMKSFVDRFARWKFDPTIDFSEKAGDLKDFGYVREAVLKVLARAAGRPLDR